MLQEAEDLYFPRVPALDLIEAHLVLDDVAGAERIAERHERSGRPRVSSQIELPHASSWGEVDLDHKPVRAGAAKLDSEHILFRIAMARAKTSDLSYARQILRNPLLVELEVELAQTLWRNGYFEDAKNAVRRIDPMDRWQSVWDLIYVSRFELAAGRLEDAQETLRFARKILSLQPSKNSTSTHIRLAQQLLHVGLDQEAWEILSQVLTDLSQTGGSSWSYWDTKQLLELADDFDDTATSKALVTALADWLNQYPLRMGEQEQRLVFARLAELGYLTKEKLDLLPYDEPYRLNRAIAEAAIVDAVTARGDLDVAIATANSTADDGARCSAMVTIVEELVARGDLDGAMSVAKQNDTDVCYKPQGLMGVPATWQNFHDDDPFGLIAVAAAYAAESQIACQALSKTSSQHIWQKTIDEMAAVRSAQGNLDAARALARHLSLQPTRQADALVRAAILYPAPWQP